MISTENQEKAMLWKIVEDILFQFFYSFLYSKKLEYSFKNLKTLFIFWRDKNL